MYRLLLICFACLCPYPLFSHDGFLFRYINLPEALQDANINEAVADSHGMLWFYTSHGLNRYDGAQLLTFNLVTQPSVLENSIVHLYADKTDHLWIGTQNGLIRFDLKSWTTSRIQPVAVRGAATTRPLSVRTINEGLDGTIYIGTDNALVYRVEQDGLVQAADLHDLFPGAESSIPVDLVTEPAAGSLWAVCNGRFVLLRKNKNGYTKAAFYPMPTLKGQISSQVCFLSSGKILFYVERQGIYTWDGNAAHQATRLVISLGRFTGPCGKGTFYAACSQPAGHTGEQTYFLHV